jgi:hypothetical protein
MDETTHVMAQYCLELKGQQPLYLYFLSVVEFLVAVPSQVQKECTTLVNH